MQKLNILPNPHFQNSMHKNYFLIESIKLHSSIFFTQGHFFKIFRTRFFKTRPLFFEKTHLRKKISRTQKNALN